MNLTYEPVLNWGRLPDGWDLVEVAGVAVDSHDNVYVFNRGEHPVIAFDTAGRFLNAWGEGQFVRPHGLTIDAEDALWLTDDKDHTVRKYTGEGRLLMTLGTSGVPSETGMEAFDYRKIKHGGRPFNYPTNTALGSRGEVYVADGYGNARVHKFSPEGRLMASWGEPGSGPVQFNIPHGIAVDLQGRVIVADRENSRLQLISSSGEHLETWSDVVRPCQVFTDPEDRIFVAELGLQAGLWPWMDRDPQAVSGRISVFDSDGRLLARWSADLYAPHDICADSQGSVYLGSVTQSAGGGTGQPCLRKFAKAAVRS